MEGDAELSHVHWGGRYYVSNQEDVYLTPLIIDFSNIALKHHQKGYFFRAVFAKVEINQNLERNVRIKPKNADISGYFEGF